MRFRPLLLILLLALAPATAHAWALGDTLTTIWKPLPNLPALVRPGDTLTVWANAPGAADRLERDADVRRLLGAARPVGGGYDASRVRWELGFLVPSGVPEEVYDLVAAIGARRRPTRAGTRSRCCRRSAPTTTSRRSPTRTCRRTRSRRRGRRVHGGGHVGLPGLRRGDRAISNLIHPEFILHTGDLVNEGELEDYLQMYEMSRAQGSAVAAR